uniref:Dolichol phosphate-mannose biosynthesis regulatory protein n=1 Tax=Tetradesmus obliquus TaxID=3088 RepID=A0A383WEP4_TETOB|eukprot:jgi/Sobl393_1/5323/SZX75632.1
MSCSISLGQFVQQPSQQLAINALPHIQLTTPRCLLLGPQRSGKTSLLFQYAFQLACSGQEVVFMCDRAQLDQAPPLLPFGASQQHAAFSRIHFKYVSDLHQLRKYGACLHLLQQPPAAIIVDDVAHLLANTRLPDKRARDTEVTRALAYLADGLDQLRPSPACCWARLDAGCSAGLQAERACRRSKSCPGKVLLIATVASFAYISLWLLVKPFIDSDQPILALLPDTRHLYLPLSALLLATLGSILAYVGWLIILEPTPVVSKED